MPPPPVGEVGHPALSGQVADEPAHLGGQPPAVQTTKANVEKNPFPEAPPIALPVRAEVELRHLGLHPATPELPRVHPKLDLLSHDHGLGFTTAPQQPCNGTKAPPRSHQHAHAYLGVH